MRLNREYVEQLKDSYSTLSSTQETMAFILALRTLNIDSEQILYITS